VVPSLDGLAPFQIAFVARDLERFVGELDTGRSSRAARSDATRRLQRVATPSFHRSFTALSTGSEVRWPGLGCVALIGGETRTNLDIVDAWRAQGIDAWVVHPADGLRVLTYGDVAVGRIDVRGSLDGVEPGLFSLLQLARRGLRVLNGPSALLRAHDKLLTARQLTAARVPHPPTEHVTAGQLPRLRPPVVLKPRFGSWGAEVIRCDSEGELRRALAGLVERPWFRRQGVLAQALVPPVGYDLRVLVAGGRVVGGQSRVAAPGEWRTNVSLGASRATAAIPLRARLLALAAARAVSGDLVGVDLLPSDGDYVVLEVNGAVDFAASYALPGGNVFADLAAALELAAPLASVPALIGPS
jgi:RimK family alpha-L-glutamate ligase